MQRIKNEKGFTLIEMMIVLLIISVLILIAIPNVTKHSKSIDAKGCAAYLNTIVVKYTLLKIHLYHRFIGCIQIK